MILIFGLAGLRALIGKIALLVIVVTNDPAQVPIFLTCWLVAALIIWSRSFGRIDSNGRGGTLRPEAAGVAIATIAITLSLLVVPAKSFGIGGFEAIRKHALYLLMAERKGALVPDVIFGRF